MPRRLKISVVVPVYNSAPYLRECIDSILSQTFKDFELILVDDGSTDDSSVICEEFARLTTNLYVIHQPNGGASAARNRGISLAGGENITFIDSDDTVAPDFLEGLLEANSSDLACAGIVWQQPNKTSVTDGYTDARIYHLDREDDFTAVISLPRMTSPVAKLYKTDILQTYDMAFDPQLDYGEDRDFNLQYLARARTVSTSTNNAYYYRRGIATSLSVRKCTDCYANDCRYWLRLQRLFDDRKFYSVSSKRLLAERLFHIVSDWSLRTLNEDRRVDEILNAIPDEEFWRKNISCVRTHGLWQWSVRHGFTKLMQVIYKLKCHGI